MKIRMEFNNDEVLACADLVVTAVRGLGNYQAEIDTIATSTSEWDGTRYISEYDINSLFVIDLCKLIETNFHYIKSMGIKLPLEPLKNKWFESRDLSEYERFIKEGYQYSIEFKDDSAEVVSDIYDLFHVLKTIVKDKSTIACVLDLKSGRVVTKEVLPPIILREIGE